MKKMWYRYTMEYYSAIKRNKMMPFAATWMDVESVIVSEVKQKRRPHGATGRAPSGHFSGALLHWALQLPKVLRWGSAGEALKVGGP